MEKLIQTLSSLGLSEKESKVYIALLQLGRASSYSISSRSQLKKPTTYVILDELINKGIVKKIPRVKKQQYVALPPEELFANAEERLKQAKKALPELITMAENEKVKVQTLFYEGIGGVEEALRFNIKEMNGKELVGFYATGEDANKELLDVFNIYPNEIFNAGIKVRGITPEHESTREMLELDRKHGLIVKTVPVEMYSSKVSIEAGDTFVRIILMKPQQALIIKNQELAQCIKQVFEIVYSQIK